ncbi:ZIP family metal transporter [Candidatus Bathyarchaeota archaeon]|nr:ZIP family metal transporter [Candidatus Bathyarchaeota archaeon]
MSETVYLGFASSLAAGLATGIGSLPVFFIKRFSDSLMDVLLGFSAGVMMAATAFSLLVPAISIGGPLISVLGVIFGALTISFLDKIIPHFHAVAGPEGPVSRLSKIWLFIIAITMHNFPEGLAVGVSFGSGDISRGIVVATAIGLQNAPEGLAVALPLLREKYGKARSVGYATLTGLVEPVGGLIGVVLVTSIQAFLPWGMAFAAGAMLFVIVDEMVPESHKKGFGREASLGFLIGFVVMMLLDSLLK